MRVSQLITDAIRRLEPDVDAVKELRYLQETQDFHSDRITELVLDRLRKPDCRINGWVLDGCPFTLAQIKDLKDEKVTPQLVIALELNDKRLEERLKQYYYDPITHFMYFEDLGRFAPFSMHAFPRRGNRYFERDPFSSPMLMRQLDEAVR